MYNPMNETQQMCIRCMKIPDSHMLKLLQQLIAALGVPHMMRIEGSKLVSSVGDVDYFTPTYVIPILEFEKRNQKM